MTRPSALVIGPMKAGTSWIHDYLHWRGDVCLPHGVKETFFFDRYAHRTEDWYTSHFSAFDPDRHRLAMEVAPSLFHAQGAPERIRRLLGPVRLVATLRDPVARSWSHYLHLRRRGYTNAPLVDAVADFPEILEASRYDTQLLRWRAAFPEQELAVLHLEDLVNDRSKYIEHLCSALDLPLLGPPPELGQASNAAGDPPSFQLARVGRHAARLIRSVGGYGIVNAAKRLGLKRVVFGQELPANRRIWMTPEEEAWLISALADKSVHILGKNYTGVAQ